MNEDPEELLIRVDERMAQLTALVRDLTADKDQRTLILERVRAAVETVVREDYLLVRRLVREEIAARERARWSMWGLNVPQWVVAGAAVAALVLSVRAALQ